MADGLGEAVGVAAALGAPVLGPLLGAADDTVTVGLAEPGAELVALATDVLPEEPHAVSTSTTPADDTQAATRPAHDK